MHFLFGFLLLATGWLSVNAANEDYFLTAATTTGKKAFDYDAFGKATPEQRTDRGLLLSQQVGSGRRVLLLGLDGGLWPVGRDPTLVSHVLYSYRSAPGFEVNYLTIQPPFGGAWLFGLLTFFFPFISN